MSTTIPHSQYVRDEESLRSAAVRADRAGDKLSYVHLQLQADFIRLEKHVVDLTRMVEKLRPKEVGPCA